MRSAAAAMNHIMGSLPSCFTGGANVAGRSEDGGSKMHQSIVSSVYQVTIGGMSVIVTLTWFRTTSGADHSLTVSIDSVVTVNIDLSPPSFYLLFKKKRGCKGLKLSRSDRSYKLAWDFSKACFPDAAAEPTSGFFLALVQDESEVVFLLGGGSSPSPSPPPLAAMSRREHVFGRRKFVTRAVFPGAGGGCDIKIDCSGGAMRVAVDGKAVLVVKSLAWKFRGNERIVIGGAGVEFYWDVFNWVAGGGCGVFVFQVGEGGVWAEMGPEERKMMKRCSSNSAGAAAGASPAAASSAGSWSSVMQWSEEESWCGSLSSASSRTSSSSWSTSGGIGRRNGFSLMLYAWDWDCSVD